MFDLKQIQCFVAVGEELHFGRAARRMFMTQPPLSRQIRLLEDDLKIQLLVRTSRSVRLTPAGKLFLQEARKLLSLASNASLAAQRVSRGESGLLHLGFTAGSSYGLLPRLMTQAKEMLRNVDLVLHEMPTGRQVEALQARVIDAGLLHLPSEKDDLRSVCVAREPMLLAVPRGHRLARGPLPALKDLQGEPFLTYDPQDGGSFYELIEGLFRSASIPTRYVQNISQVPSMLALVSAKQGVALVPESARALHFQGIVIRRIRRPIFAEMFLAWRNDNENPVLPHLCRLAIKSFAVSMSRTQ